MPLALKVKQEYDGYRFELGTSNFEHDILECPTVPEVVSSKAVVSRQAW